MGQSAVEITTSTAVVTDTGKTDIELGRVQQAVCHPSWWLASAILTDRTDDSPIWFETARSYLRLISRHHCDECNMDPGWNLYIVYMTHPSLLLLQLKLKWSYG